MEQPGSRKRKRLSKNKKKSWKFTDVKDVEEYLDDKRLQERTGGLVEEKSDEQLFFVDTQVEKESPVPPKRKKRELKPLRCHASLEPDPHIKPAKLKRNVKTKIRKKVLPTTAEKEFVKAAVAETRRQQGRAAARARRAARRSKPGFNQDLWASEEPVPAEQDVVSHHLTVTRKVPVRGRKTMRRKPSEVAAVEVAHPGASYNPTFDDHQELLSVAHAVEERKLRAELKVTRALDDMFPSQKPAEEDYLREMSAGLSGNESDQDGGASGSEEDSDPDRLSVNPPVRREDKKTLQQRRRERLKIEEETKMNKNKSAKERKREIYRLKQIKKDVNEIVAEQEAAAEKRAAEKRETDKRRTKKLGYLKFEEPEVELKLSDELEGSLRRLKPEGHLLQDRFKSLQKRNVIEPRKRTKIVRKYKAKVFEKKGHKSVTS